MASLSPAMRARLHSLREFETQFQRVHGLVEQYAGARDNADQYLIPLNRAFGRLRLDLNGAGLDAMSQLCASMQMTIRRGLPPQMKIRILRDSVGSLRYQLELEIRSLLAEIKEATRREAEEAGSSDPPGG